MSIFMQNDENKFFEGLDVFGKLSVYVSARVLRQNVLTTIYLCFFSLLLESITLTLKFLLGFNKGSICGFSEEYAHIYLIIVCLFVQVYLRILKKDLVNHETSATICMVFFGVSLIVCNTIFSVGELQCGRFPVSFFISSVFYFCILVIEPIKLVFTSSASLILMLIVSIDKIDMYDVASFVVLLFVLNLVGFVHYSVAKHRYGTEESLYEANSVLLQMSIYDNLTGLKNRNALRQDFENMVGKNCFMMICDIDDFKFFNDTFGHAAGDKVLESVAHSLSGIFGKECCYRFGGDEFIVLTNDPIERFEELYCKFENKISSTDIPGIDIKPTLSGGGAYGLCSNRESLRYMMKVADDALYRVKRSGKNHLIIEKIPK